MSQALLIWKALGQSAGSVLESESSTFGHHQPGPCESRPLLCSGMLGTRLADVLGGGHVRWMLISNYMIDVGWLLSAVPSILAADRVVLVHGERNNPKA